MTTEAAAAAHSFHVCPGCATEAIPQTADENKFECSACAYVMYFNPGSAVAAILQAPDGRALFLRRERDPGKGMLGLPGGFIDPGETAEIALSREVHEETGLHIDQWDYLTSSPNIYNYRGIAYNVTDLFFTSSLANFDGILLDTTESAAWLAMPRNKHSPTKRSPFPQTATL